VPSCDGKQCGDNGCGGDCGPCGTGQVCSRYECISDTMGQPCPGGNDDCTDPEVCLQITDNATGNVIAEFCSDTCAENVDCEGLGGCCEGESDKYCLLRPFCSGCTGCAGRECGTDNCGVVECGTCTGGEVCSAGGLCVPCTPDCTGRECGSDGCDGSCGPCGSLEYCDQAGQCQCIPDCRYRECGTDGCGGSCGICPHGLECVRGTCEEP
jgi:hypothetical protein